MGKNIFNRVDEVLSTQKVDENSVHDDKLEYNNPIACPLKFSSVRDCEQL